MANVMDDTEGEMLLKQNMVGTVFQNCATTSKLFWSPIEPPQDQNRLTSKPGSLFILWRPGILNISTSVRMIPCPFNPKPEPNDDSEDDIQNRVKFFSDPFKQSVQFSSLVFK